jgi:two-component system OmpR family sensor kinase
VVTDQGPGVKAEKLNTVFEPFVQAEAANGQGYGLGLTIAQRAIKAHGGTIAARNGTEKGLVVSIWLPAAAGVSGAAEKEEISPVFEHGEAPVAL